MPEFTGRFPLGQVVGTPAALKALHENGKTPEQILARHVRGDWGDELCEEDWKVNEQALVQGHRILSAYRISSGTKIWVITEADRSSTCLLLPEEY